LKEKLNPNQIRTKLICQSLYITRNATFLCSWFKATAWIGIIRPRQSGVEDAWKHFTVETDVSHQQLAANFTHRYRVMQVLNPVHSRRAT